MEYIYMHTGRDGVFEWVSKTAFQQRFKVLNAIAYLKQVRHSLQKEALRERASGHFYTGVRHAFAEIDGLGKFYLGEEGKRNTTANAIAFGENYLGRVDERYKELFGLLYDLYRHSLIHTHMARNVRFQVKRRWYRLFWDLTESTSDHLELVLRGKRVYSLVLSVPRFVRDTVSALDSYIDDLKTVRPASKLFARFRRGYYGTAVAFRDSQRPNKLCLSGHSISGMTWIKNEVVTLES